MFLKMVILYGLTLVVFLGIDLVWLLKIAPKFYRKHIGHLMADKPNGPAALVFYLLFIVGIVVFAVYPSYDHGLWWQAPLYGALFGLMTYGTYDLTNMATLKGWPIKVTVIDLIWGTSLSAVTSTIVFFLATLLGV